MSQKTYSVVEYFLTMEADLCMQTQFIYTSKTYKEKQFTCIAEMGGFNCLSHFVCCSQENNVHGHTASCLLLYTYLALYSKMRLSGESA